MPVSAADNEFFFRSARPDDLAAINRVIIRSIETWNLSARVKRVSIPLYQYHLTDLNFLQMTVAVGADGAIAGVAACEPASQGDAPEELRALLLHGIYVDPVHQGMGIGGRLLEQVIEIAVDGGYDGLLVKAQIDASGFFAAQGLEHLPVTNPLRDYPHRYWRDLRQRNKRDAA